MLNCSFIDHVDPLPDVKDGDIFVSCKMSQRTKTPLFTGKKITILGGDWSNVVLDDNFIRDEHAVFCEHTWAEDDTPPQRPKGAVNA
jgi:hypothetical protein